jgi:oxygen-independent coproporphyrinogen-3 oxidase
MINKRTGLYIHIPFCMKKCDYCDFLSFPATEQVKEQYVKQLITELQVRSVALKDCMIDTVFLGGGTPSVLGERQIAEIMNTVQKYFAIDKEPEITMEMNPGTVNFEKLLGYKKAGINRVSFGVQSMDNKELKLLGRIHSVKEFQENYEAARKAGFSNINIDLMSALPNQTLMDVQKNVMEAVKLAPEHLSCYGLIIEEGTLFYRKYEEQELRRQAGEELPEDELPTEHLEREMYQWIGEYLKEQGYVQYEISNYAKPGMECRHNLKYWERKEYLGVGLGAASFLGDIRSSNVRSMETYLQTDIRAEVEALTDEKEVIDEASAMAEFMFLGLRKMQGISKTEFYKSFGREYMQVYGTVHEKMVKQGLLEEKEDRVYLSKQGIDVSNYVMGEFL